MFTCSIEFVYKFVLFDLVALEANTLNKRLSEAYNVGTTPRYSEYEKNKLAMANAAEAGMFPTPYSTLPVEAVPLEVGIIACDD